MERRVWDWSQLKPPLLPVRDWLPHYERRWLRPDVVAAAAVWAVLGARGHGLRLARRPAARDRPLRRPRPAARVRRPRHLSPADGRPELGDRRLLGGRRGAAGARRQRPLHRPVGAARPPRRRAPAGRRPRPRRLHRRLLRPPGADGLRRRTGARHRRGAAVQALRCGERRHQLLRQARGAGASARRHQSGHAGHRGRGPGDHLRAAGLRAQGAGDAGRRRAGDRRGVRPRSPGPRRRRRRRDPRRPAAPHLPELQPRGHHQALAGRRGARADRVRRVDRRGARLRRPSTATK